MSDAIFEDKKYETQLQSRTLIIRLFLHLNKPYTGRMRTVSPSQSQSVKPKWGLKAADDLQRRTKGSPTSARPSPPDSDLGRDLERLRYRVANRPRTTATGEAEGSGLAAH